MTFDDVCDLRVSLAELLGAEVGVEDGSFHLSCCASPWCASVRLLSRLHPTAIPSWSPRLRGALIRTSSALTLRPDDPRWPAFVAWAKDRRLLTSRLLGFRAGAGVSLVWAEGTEWEAQVTLPMGQALGHLIAERNWRDVDFPDFFAERGGVYGINLAERLAMLDPGSPAPWQAFFDSPDRS